MFNFAPSTGTKEGKEVMQYAASVKQESLNVYNKPNASSKELEDQLIKTSQLTPSVQRGSLSARFDNHATVSLEVTKDIARATQNRVIQCGVDFVDKFTPAITKPFSETLPQDISVVPLPTAVGGEYDSTTNTISINGKIVTEADLGFPAPAFSAKEVELHERRHQENWQKEIIPFLKDIHVSQTKNAPKSVSSGTVTQSDVIMPKDLPQPPFALEVFDEALAYCEAIIVNGARTLEGQILHMQREETYAHYAAPAKTHAEYVTVVTAAALEMGMTPQQFISTVIQAYQGNNPYKEGKTHDDNEIIANEYTVIEKVKASVIEYGKQKGIISNVEPFTQLTEHAKRHFIRGELKKKIIELSYCEALVETYEKTPEAQGKMLFFARNPVGPLTDWYLDVNTEAPSPYLLHKGNLHLSTFPAVVENETRHFYTLTLTDVNRITGEVLSSDAFSRIKSPAIIERIAKSFVKEMPSADLAEMVLHSQKNSTFIESSLDMSIHKLGEAIIRETAKKGMLNADEARHMIEKRDRQRQSMLFTTSVNSMIVTASVVVDPAIRAQRSAIGKEGITVVENSEAKVIAVDIGNRYGDDKDGAFLTVILPTEQTVKAAKQYPADLGSTQKMSINIQYPQLSETSSENIEAMIVNPYPLIEQLLTRTTDAEKNEIAKAFREGRVAFRDTGEDFFAFDQAPLWDNMTKSLRVALKSAGYDVGDIKNTQTGY